LLPVERQIFAVAANRLFGGEVENEDGTVNFGASALDWLSCFQRNRAGKFFLAIVNAGRNLAQNSLPFEGGQSPGGAERLDGGGNGRVRVFAASLVHVRDEGAVIRRANIDDVSLLQPLPVQEETVGCNWNHRHLGHASPLSIARVIRLLRFESRFLSHDYRTSRGARCHLLGLRKTRSGSISLLRPDICDLRPVSFAYLRFEAVVALHLISGDEPI